MQTKKMRFESLKSFYKIKQVIRRIRDLVGERTQAKKACGESNKDCSIGIAKAPVFPEPVCARPIRSLPGTKTNQIVYNKK